MSKAISLIVLIFLPSLVFGQVVIPGTGGAVTAPPAGQRTSVIPGLCIGTNKVIGISTSGAIQCNTDVTGTTSPLTTKGDLWGFSTVVGRVAVSSNDQCLVADSAQAFGFKWGSCAAGGTVCGLDGLWSKYSVCPDHPIIPCLQVGSREKADLREVVPLGEPLFNRRSSRRSDATPRAGL